MAQIFPAWSNRVPALLAAAATVAILLVVSGAWYTFSPRFTDVGYQPRQPVPFSHRLHAGELEIDCRYCHDGVETEAVAAVPPTATCMKCHQLVARDKETTAAIHASAEHAEPLRWIRVHNVPDYAYFDHAVHIRAGVGCQSCHGEVAAMDEIRQVEPLSMRWCLECHRDPALALRPRAAITDTAWTPPPDQESRGAALLRERGITPPTDCSACHR